MLMSSNQRRAYLLRTTALATIEIETTPRHRLSWDSWYIAGRLASEMQVTGEWEW